MNFCDLYLFYSAGYEWSILPVKVISMLVSVVACCRYNNVVASMISSFGLWVVPQIALHRYLIVDDGCYFFCSLLGIAKTANAVCSVSLVRVIRCNRCFIKLRVWVQGQFRAKPSPAGWGRVSDRFFTLFLS
jgi:hypothetical protein